jgi:hypothetical protein
MKMTLSQSALKIGKCGQRETQDWAKMMMNDDSSFILMAGYRAVLPWMRNAENLKTDGDRPPLSLRF